MPAGYFFAGQRLAVSDSMNNYIAIILAIIAVLLVAEFAVEFADWNKQQECASSGRRNCGASRVLLNH